MNDQTLVLTESQSARISAIAKTKKKYVQDIPKDIQFLKEMREIAEPLLDLDRAKVRDLIDRINDWIHELEEAIS